MLSQAPVILNSRRRIPSGRTPRKEAEMVGQTMCKKLKQSIAAKSGEMRIREAYENKPRNPVTGVQTVGKVLVSEIPVQVHKFRMWIRALLPFNFFWYISCFYTFPTVSLPVFPRNGNYSWF
jgi:hypothetical protein